MTDASWLLKSCPRCGGDLATEPRNSEIETHSSCLSCLQCGELRFVEPPPLTLNPADFVVRRGRPRRNGTHPGS